MSTKKGALPKSQRAVSVKCSICGHEINGIATLGGNMLVGELFDSFAGVIFASAGYATCPSCLLTISKGRPTELIDRPDLLLKKIKAHVESLRQRQVIKELLDGLSTKAKGPLPKKPK